MKRLVFVFLWFLAGPMLAQSVEVPEERVVLDAPINSQYTETRPFVSHDGKQLYISRRESPDNQGGHRDFMDIYRSEKLPDGSWSEPVNLGPTVNTKKADALACIGEDGKTLYLFNTARKPRFPLYTTTEQEDGSFSKKEPVEVENYYNDNDYMDFFVSEKFGVMFLAIERTDSRGDQDIYVSIRQPDGTYSEPQHAGATINSGSADFAPYLGPSGKRLYFASYGFGGHGSADIFYAERLGDSWTSWGRATNLGPGLNTRGQDVYFSFTKDFHYIYIESWDQAHQDRDITMVTFPQYLRPEIPEPEPEPESEVIALATEAEAPALSPEAEAAIDAAAETQRNQRERNREALASSLATEVEPIAEAEAEPIMPDPEPVEPPVTAAPPLQDLNSTAKVEPRQPETSNLSGGAFFYLASEESQWVRERERNNRRELKYLRNMYFEVGSAKVNRDYEQHLNRIVEYMNDYPDLQLTIDGHTDVLGSDSWNLRLSQKRAEATAAYLIAQGVPQHRMVIRGLGDDYPLASNDDERDGRELNRRVEIALIPMGQ